MNGKKLRIAVMVLSVGLLVSVVACVLSPMAWSPDGKWISFIRFVSDGKSDNSASGSELWILSPSPIERRRLLATSGTLSGASWQRDGKGLYVMDFTDKDGSKSTALLQVALDGQRKILTQLKSANEAEGAFFIAPLPFPDGRRIAFARDKRTVDLVSIDGRLERTISLSGDLGELALSPDGRWLVVTLDGGGGGPSIVFHDLRSSETLPLDARFGRMAWLPDGKRFIAVKVQGAESPEKAFLSVFDGVTDRREVSSWPTEFAIEGPLVLTPKGDTVYFAHDGGDEGLSGIYGMDLSNGKTAVRYQTPGAVCPWAVSPDGARLAFRESARGQNAGIESFGGVLDLKGTSEPLYLPADDKELAAVLLVYLEELKKLAPGKFTPAQEKIAAYQMAQAGKFMAVFKRDFSKSPLYQKCLAAEKEARAALQQAGIAPSPDTAGPRW